MDAVAKSNWIKQTATRLGFDYCGIAQATALTADAKRLETWLNKGMHGSMAYMANHFDLRIDPTKLVPGAKSVISVLCNYFPSLPMPQTDDKISKYAWGEDYHEVIRPKLRQLLQEMQTQFGAIEGRGFVDSAPVLERSWAQKSGLGWVGKNGNLINKKSGSFYFIATLIVDLPLAYDSPMVKDFCGSCTRCIDACPTTAIGPNKVVDGSKCISYFTIELKDLMLPNEMKGKFDDWAFGCDTCQDVCPWNRFSKPHVEPAFQPNETLLSFSLKDWLALEETAFQQLFRKSPIKRAKYKGLLRNIQFLANK